MTINIQNTIEKNASKYKYLDSIAITQIQNLKITNKITYKKLFKLINNVSFHLLNLKIQKEEKVYISTNNSLNFIVTFLGAIKVGIVPIPGNPELNLEQTNHIIKDSKPKLIISDNAKILNINKSINNFKNKKWLELLKINTDININHFTPKINSPAFIIYTSGTTGNPKGIIHHHQSIENTTNLHKNIIKLKINDKIFTTSKLFFAYALGNNLFAPLLLGLNTIFSDSNNYLITSEIIKKHKPKTFFSVPTMYRRILKNNKEDIKVLKEVKYFVSAGERVPNKLYEEWQKKTKTTLLNCYGTSETLAIIIATRPKKERIGSTGKPIDSIKTKLVSKRGKISNKRGILHVKHSSFSNKYLNNNLKSNSTFVSGWINTGDIWEIKNNHWYFDGREDELIKVAGKWVNPKEIEKIAHEISEILDAFCVTALSRDHTNRIALFLYTKNKNNNIIIMKKINKNIELLPNYKKPHWIKIIYKLPQTSTGKVKRKTLQKMIENNNE